MLIDRDCVINTAPIRKDEKYTKRQSNRLSFYIQKNSKNGLTNEKVYVIIMMSVEADTPLSFVFCVNRPPFFHLYNRRLIRGVSLIRMPGL